MSDPIGIKKYRVLTHLTGEVNVHDRDQIGEIIDQAIALAQTEEVGVQVDIVRGEIHVAINVEGNTVRDEALSRYWMDLGMWLGRDGDCNPYV